MVKMDLKPRLKRPTQPSVGGCSAEGILTMRRTSSRASPLRSGWLKWRPECSATNSQRIPSTGLQIILKSRTTGGTPGKHAAHGAACTQDRGLLFEGASAQCANGIGRKERNVAGCRFPKAA